MDFRILDYRFLPFEPFIFFIWAVFSSMSDWFGSSHRLGFGSLRHCQGSDSGSSSTRCSGSSLSSLCLIWPSLDSTC